MKTGGRGKAPRKRRATTGGAESKKRGKGGREEKTEGGTEKVSRGGEITKGRSGEANEGKGRTMEATRNR